MRRHKLKFKKLVAVILGIVFLAGISRGAETGAGEWTTVMSEGLPAASQQTALDEKLSQKISLDYKDVDIASVLRSLSWTYGLNIVTSPDVKGRVTISLKDVSVNEAIEAILAVNGLTYSVRKGIIYVGQGDLKALDAHTEVIFLKYLAAGEAQNLLRKVISTQGDIKIDEVANSLIVTDFALNIEKVKQLLEKIDVAPRQVLIEAKIVDITSSDLEAIGVTWSADYNPGKGIFGRKTKSSERLQGELDMSEQSSSLTGGQFVLDTLTFKGLPTFTATIDALVKDGKANLLASPSIAVLNGQEARIVIGERYPYKERTQTTSGTTETTKFVDIGTTLRVSPQINEDGYITMRIHPEVSSLASALDAGPRITTREADTTVRVKEGETLVIGGLIKHKDDKNIERIPILGYLPIIGFFFSRRDRDAEQKELAVFITPKILRSREEKAEIGKKARKEEAYVHLEKIGELTVVERIFEEARALEEGRGLESRRKAEVFRKTQAVNLYENIFAEFPESPRAPEAMYRAAIVYSSYFKDGKTAGELFSRLVSDYPESEFAPRAKRRYKQSAKPVSPARPSGKPAGRH